MYVNIGQSIPFLTLFVLSINRLVHIKIGVGVLVIGLCLLFDNKDLGLYIVVGI